MRFNELPILPFDEVPMKRLTSRPYLVFALAMVCALATAARAASFTGAVKAVRVDSDGRAMVQFTAPITGLSSCCTAGTCLADSLGFDTKTAGGKALLTLVTTAKLSGKGLQVTTASACTVYPGFAEDVQSGVLQP
jgi:hypothetical protein